MAGGRKVASLMAVSAVGDGAWAILALPSGTQKSAAVLAVVARRRVARDLFSAWSCKGATPRKGGGGGHTNPKRERGNVRTPSLTLRVNNELAYASGWYSQAISTAVRRFHRAAATGRGRASR